MQVLDRARSLCSTASAKVAAVVAIGAASASSAMAAVPADVTTSLSDLKADGLTVAGAVLVALIAIYAIKFMRKGL